MKQGSSPSSTYRWIIVSALIAATLLTFSMIAMVGQVQAQTGAIRGTVSYYGSATGIPLIQIAVFTTTVTPLPPPVATADTPLDSGAYLVSDMESGTYYVFAYVDINNNYSFDEGTEPFAWYDYEGNGRPSPVTVAGGTVRDIDVLLTDLWQPLGGPLAEVSVIAVQPGTPTTLYAAVGRPFGGTQPRIYRSTDGADNWSPVYTATGGTLRALAAAGPLVYAGGETPAGRGLILRSQDNGNTWSDFLSGTAADGGAFRDLAVDPLVTSTAYAAGVIQGPSTNWARLGRIYRTEDTGTTWTPVLTVTDSDLLAIALNPVTPATLYTGGYYREGGVQRAAVYRSLNGGQDWTQALTATDGPGQQFTDLLVHPITPTIIYAGSQNPKHVYRSEDGGETWTDLRLAEPGLDRGFRLALDAPQTLYAADDWRELARSDDNGETWDLRVGDLTPGIIESLALDATTTPGTVFLGFRDSGIYRSLDFGDTWAARNAGIAATTQAYQIALDPQNHGRFFVATDCDGGWRTEDRGQTWEQALGGCVRAFAPHPQDTSIVYAGLVNDPDRAIMRSIDGGGRDTFGTIYPGDADIEVLAIAPAATNLILAGGEQSAAALLIRSLDGGDTWSSLAVLEDGKISALAIHPTDPDVAYAGVQDRSTDPSTGAVYRTLDGGASWQAVLSGAAGTIHDLAIDPSRPDTVYATDDQTVHRSTDGGTTWTVVQTYEEPNRNLLAIDPRMPDHVYVAGPGHIAESIDGGQTWSDWSAPINQGTEGRSATALAVDAGTITQTLYAGFDPAAGEGGIWFYIRPAPQSSDFTTERVLGGLSQPTALAWAPDGRMFIAHQDGRVLVYTDETLTEFIDLSDEVNNNWNRGMIGIAVHPEFPTEPYIYLLYTYDPPELGGAPGAIDGPNGYGSRVSRLVRVTARAADGYNVADPDSKMVILGQNSTYANIGDPADAGGEDYTQPACANPDGTPIIDCLPSEGPSHSIGWVAFGHDGNLFVSNGEGAPYLNPDPRAARAQELDSLGGKILRIDPETGQGLPDNPFYNGDPTSNRSRVWASGLRNPFRFALHPTENIVYAGDVGWYSWEELNTAVPGANFGWPCYEGGASDNLRHSLYETYTGTQTICSELYAQEPDNGIDVPLYAYQNINGAAIVAGDFYTGTRYPEAYQGALFIADYDRRWIRYLTFDEDGNALAYDFMEEISELGGPVYLGLGPDGYLYYVALNPNPNGPSEIRRILFTDVPAVQVDAAPTSGRAPLMVQFTSTLSFVPEAYELAYSWSFGDGGTAAEPNPAHTYVDIGTYTAALTVTTPQGRSSSDRVTIVVGDTAPTAIIEHPAPGSTYVMGTPLSFSGRAEDDQDGDLPASGLQWTAQLYFNEHFHSPFYQTSGVTSGDIPIPLHNDNTTIFICLTATDSAGLRDTACVEVVPQTALYTFDTVPSDFQLFYDGIAYTTPFTIDMMVNAPRTIRAPLEQGGMPFYAWSTGGAAEHVIVGQPTPQTLIATYGTPTPTPHPAMRIWLPLIQREASP